jgi:Tat protein secretion system quality control protein TatD with DNase activity
LQAILSQYPTIPAIVLHSASSCSIETARLLAAQDNVYFSFTARGLLPRVKQLILSCPKNRFLLETDSPSQLLPSLKRPDAAADELHNTPANLRTACEEISAACGLDCSQLALLSLNNAKRVFDFAV